MSLEEIEQALLQRLDYLQRQNDEGFERPPFGAWLEIYQALAQVKQAQAAERIADRLDDIGKDMSAVNLSDL